MHQLINPIDNYEPSSDLKRRWLYTKKSELKFGKLVLPGLFQSSGYKTQKILISCVLVIEIYGLYILYNVLPQPLLALIFTALDFVLAILAHLFKHQICLSKNKLILAKNGIAFRDDGKSSEYEIRYQKKKIFWRLFYERGVYAIIIILALIKMKQTLQYGSYIAVGQLILICVLYGIAALIHITTTGYFFAELWFRYGFFWGGIMREKRDLKETASHKENTNRVTTYINYDLEKKYNTVINNKQIIENKVTSSSIFKLWGILQDEELNQLTYIQGANQEDLALYLLFVQLKSLENDANRNETEELIKLDFYSKK